MVYHQELIIKIVRESVLTANAACTKSLRILEGITDDRELMMCGEWCCLNWTKPCFYQSKIPSTMCSDFPNILKLDALP